MCHIRAVESAVDVDADADVDVRFKDPAQYFVVFVINNKKNSYLLLHLKISMTREDFAK